MEVDGGDKVPDVAKAVDLLRDRLDFVVDAFDGGVGGAESEEGQDAGEVFLQALGDVNDRARAAVGRPEVPLLKEALCVGWVDVVPKVPKVLLDGMRANGF